MYHVQIQGGQVELLDRRTLLQGPERVFHSSASLAFGLAASPHSLKGPTNVESQHRSGTAIWRYDRLLLPARPAERHKYYYLPTRMSLSMILNQDDIISPLYQGFRMLVGDPFRRKGDDIDPNTARAQATTFRCFQGTSPGAIGAPGAPPGDTFHLPNEVCTGGIRSNIYFPQ